MRRRIAEIERTLEGRAFLFDDPDSYRAGYADAITALREAQPSQEPASPAGHSLPGS